MPAKLYTSADDGVFRQLRVPEYEFTPLDTSADQMRFLVLRPCPGDLNDEVNHVVCTFELHSLSETPEFTAVVNSRGYLRLQEAIEVDGKALLVPVALERFLRHFRKPREPVRLWIRQLCLFELDPAEKERYYNWTFVETMYNSAKSHADMKAFLIDLLDQGRIDTLTDARYATYTKSWNEMSEPKLPSYFPKRLETRYTTTPPWNDFQYVDLDPVAKEMRVAILQKAGDPTDPLMVSLAHAPSHSAGTYIAVSYAWDHTGPMCELILSNQKTMVRKGLETMLRTLHSSGGEISVWVDAICINQDNLEERNRHLTRMHEIFLMATDVICYVGEATTDSDLALELALSLGWQYRILQDKDGNWFANKDRKQYTKEELPRLCAALYKLLLRPYFRRVWMIQEVTFASNPTVLCGAKGALPLRSLDSAATNLQLMLSQDHSLLVETQKLLLPEIKAISYNELDYVRILFFFRHAESGGESSLFPFPQPQTPRPGYLEAAILARNFQSTVSHDKIFSLWNVAGDKDRLNFKMDYTKSVEEAFTGFAIAWAEAHGSLDIIATSESPASPRFYAKAPSWCPDWSQPSSASNFVRRERLRDEFTAYQGDINGALYKAGGCTRGQGSFNFDGNTLHATGLVLDVIEMLGSPFDSILLDLYGCIEATKQYFALNPDFNKYSDVHQAVYAMLHGDSVSAWPPRSKHAFYKSDSSAQPYMCHSLASRHIHGFPDGSYDVSQQEGVIGMVLRGRSCFITATGYIGLAPAYLQDEKGPFHIAILATCSVPVILRELDDGCYQLLGSCFVQGWMDGEILSEFEHADTAIDFWASFEGMDRLRIR